MARDEVILGKITGTHGIRGWMKMMPYTETPRSATHYQPWVLHKGSTQQAVELEQHRGFQTQGLLVKLKGIETPEAAKLWVGSQVKVSRDNLTELDKGHYWHDLEGLAVKTTDGIDLGRISHLFETGANDVMVVKGERERLIPYRLDTVITQVDKDAGVMTVDWDAEF